MNFAEFLSGLGAERLTYAGASVSLLQNPKPALIDPANSVVVDGMIDELQTITAESFGMELDNQSNDGVRNHVVNVDSLAFIHDDNGRVLGFASSKSFSEEGVFYLHGVAIASKYKVRGIATFLVRALFERSGLPMIAFTSQNPIMYSLIRKIAHEVLPGPDNVQIPEKYVELGRLLLNGRSTQFYPESVVIRDLYGRCLYNNVPNSADPVVNQWFQNELRIRNGLTRDAFLFLGVI